MKQLPEIFVRPNEPELEESVLGVLLMERSAFERVSEILKPEKFYGEWNRMVFTAMLKLASENRGIEYLSVHNEMKALGLVEQKPNENLLRLMQLTNRVVSNASLEHWSGILNELYIRRELGDIGSATVQASMDVQKTSKEIIEEVDQRLTAIANMSTEDRMVPVEDAIVEVIKEVDILRAADHHITGIPSNLRDLDNILHGWQNEDFIIVAARPSMGKSAFAVQIADIASMNGMKQVPVAFYTLEMPTKQLVKRLLSRQSRVNLNGFMTGRISNEEHLAIHNAAGHLAKKKLFFDDTPGLSITNLKNRIRRMKRKHNIGLVVVDYLQLMTDKSKASFREQEVSSISRNLKQIAKELKIPVIALSQLSREVEKRTDKEPIMSDLRESGSLEQDADIILMLYRPEVYGKTQDENGESLIGKTLVKVAKHRNGELGRVWLRSDLATQTFTDIDSPGFYRSEQQQQTANFYQVEDRDQEGF